jgi:hypothetical protein
VTRLLYDLETDPMALKVEGLELTARDERGEQVSLGLQVSGLMYTASEMQ